MSCSEIVFYIFKDILCTAYNTTENASTVSGKIQSRMFSKISNALQAAADVVAPPCASVEDLRYHWHQVLHECHKCQDSHGKQLIVAEETHAPKHLSEMLKILVDDCAESRGSKILTPCLEYLVQERILVSLASFAWTDRPLGIRQYTFMFLSNVLNHLHHSHLHQMRIHKPLQSMVQAASDKKASPYENQEMDFIAILCEKIKEDSTIILLYLELGTLTGDSRCITPLGSTPSTPSHVTGENDGYESEASSSVEAKISAIDGSKFPLIESLLNLCHSCDARICERAHQCLLQLTSLHNPRTSTAIAKNTLLSHYIASRLIIAAEVIPLDTESSLIENISIIAEDRLVSENVISDSDEETNDEFSCEFPGKKETKEFFHWLIYSDKLIMGCDSLLASNISGIVRELFLDGFLRPFYSSSEDDDAASLYTVIITKILSLIKSTTFSNCVISWLTEESESHRDEVNEDLRYLLLKRCLTPPHHLQLQSLRLLQTMIEKPGSLAVQLLILNNVSTRGYIDSTSAEHLQNSWSDEEDERYKLREGAKNPEDFNGQDFTAATVPISRTLAPSNISVIVKRFLSLVPEAIRSTSHDDFESYKADALRQYRDVCKGVPYHTWPREAVNMELLSDTSSTASKESQTESEVSYFQEGPLLCLLLDFLEKLPEQDYDINLQVTSLVSSLALLPHPHLHEFLLNPTIPLSTGCRTPYSILKKIISQIYPVIVKKEDYRNYLKVTRFQLLGTMEELEYERDEEDSKFEALIVLEEFTKELAAIAYAKYLCEGKLCT